MNMQQFFFRRAMALAAIVAVTTVAAVGAAKAAPTLLVESGKLIGANGVDVGGTLYDVRFVDGSCADAFGTCAPSAFDFTTQGSAVEAARALAAQVFLGQFDDRPELTFGCQATPCLIATPYGGIQSGFLGSFVASGIVTNGSTESSDRAEFGGALVAGSNSNSWARWTLSPTTPVPAPASLLLAASALGLAALSTRTSRRRG